MKRIFLLAILSLSPALAFAAPGVVARSTSGVWKIDGDVMGTPVKMTCTLTQTDQKLSGVCSGAQDGYMPHKLTGKLKVQPYCSRPSGAPSCSAYTVGWSLEFSFQTYVQGNPITMIISGTLNEDWSKMDGDLDVEPMAAGGTFTAVHVQMPDASPAANTAPAAAAAPAVGSPAGEQWAATGTWKIDGDFQGTPVNMSCAIAEADHKLTGACTGAPDAIGRQLTGDVTGKGVAWRFDSEFNGGPITISMSAMFASATKMSGTIAVAPLDADGTFTAIKQ